MRRSRKSGFTLVEVMISATIAVAVAVEHGGFGASTAGPIARKIMDAWILGKQPEPETVEAAAAQAEADAIADGAVDDATDADADADAESPR